MKVVRTIDSGTLQLRVDEMNCGYTSVDQLLGFASRMNAKRGFLFVSKILGKHIPVKPSDMRESYDRMASLVGAIEDNTLVVGMAETATGMGGGIADSLSRLDGAGNVYFQHTTRHSLDVPEWFTLSEDHSHAVSHIVYEPLPFIKNDIEASRRIVLADDEISTGKTLLRLAKGYISKLEKVEVVDIVALVSWLDDEKTKWFLNELESFCEEGGFYTPKVNFHHLMRGSFDFTKNDEFSEDLPEKTDKGLATEESVFSLGRCGIKMPVHVHDSEILKNVKKDKVSIVGVGEHLYLPFLLAEQLEKSGVNVVFQSTTRSPVFHDGEVIKTVDLIPFSREGQSEVEHYIYNLNKEDMHVAVVTESRETVSWYQHLTESN